LALGLSISPSVFTVRALGIVDISWEASTQEPIGPIVVVNPVG
jgi:hypothetical protein